MGQLIRPDCADEILPPEPKWRRNGYWLPITTPTDSEEKAVILKAVFDSAQEWCALSATGDYTVDWGDGNIQNFASGVTAEHTYNYADVDLHDSSVTLGYKQAIIQIYPQNGQQLTSLNLHKKHSLYTGTGTYETGYLDIRVVGQHLTEILLGSSTKSSATYLVTFAFLECFGLGINNTIDYGYLLSLLPKLQKLYEFKLNPPTNAAGIFYQTNLLNPIPTVNTSLSTSVKQLYRLTLKNTSLLTLDLASCIDATAACSYMSSNTRHPVIKNSGNVQNFSYFFQSSPFNKVELFDTHSATDMSYFAAAMPYLTEIAAYNTANVLNISYFVLSCGLLRKLPFYNFSKVDNATGAFQGSGILELPEYDFSANKIFTSMLQNCFYARKTGVINAAAGTVFTNIVSGCGSLEYMILQGCRYTVSIANCKFPKENIEAFLAALGSAATGTQTITISGNPGTGTIYSKTATTQVSDKVVTMADTSNLAIGDRMTGAGSSLTTPIAVTFTDAGDTVNLVNHQLPNGHPVSFPSITTTTGIVIRTIYYVVNATTDNFQLAATVGGVALALTSDGSGTMIYDAVIESIDHNVSVTLSAPATSNSTGSKSFRSLNTAPALLKGFTISG